MDYIASIAEQLFVFDHHKIEDGFKQREWFYGDFGESKKSATLMIAEFAKKVAQMNFTFLPELISDKEIL